MESVGDGPLVGCRGVLPSDGHGCVRLPKGVEGVEGGVENNVQGKAGVVNGLVGGEGQIGYAVGVVVIVDPPVGVAIGAVAIEGDEVADIDSAEKAETEPRGGTDDDGGGVAGVVVADSAWVIDGVALAGGNPHGVPRVGVHYNVIVIECGKVVGLQVAGLLSGCAADAESIVGGRLETCEGGVVGGTLDGCPCVAGGIADVPRTGETAVVGPTDFSTGAFDVNCLDFFNGEGVLINVEVEPMAEVSLIGEPS